MVNEIRNSVNGRVLKYYFYNEQDTGNANDFNDNGIYSCYKNGTTNLPPVAGWHNILVSRMSANALYLMQLDMTQQGSIYYRVKGQSSGWHDWSPVLHV